MEKEEDHMRRVAAGLKLWVPETWKKEQPFFDLCDGTIASDEMVQNILFARQKGGGHDRTFYTIYQYRY